MTTRPPCERPEKLRAGEIISIKEDRLKMSQISYISKNFHFKGTLRDISQL